MNTPIMYWRVSQAGGKASYTESCKGFVMSQNLKRVTAI